MFCLNCWLWTFSIIPRLQFLLLSNLNVVAELHANHQRPTSAEYSLKWKEHLIAVMLLISTLYLIFLCLTLHLDIVVFKNLEKPLCFKEFLTPNLLFESQALSFLSILSYRFQRLWIDWLRNKCFFSLISYIYKFGDKSNVVKYFQFNKILSVLFQFELKPPAFPC